MATPSEILRKLKKPQKVSTEDKTDDKDGDKSKKQGGKTQNTEKLSSGKRNALIDFIAKNKKHAA
jgi:hypothetical protein